MDLVPNRFAIYSQPSSEFISSDSQTLLYLASLEWLAERWHSIVLYFDRNKASFILFIQESSFGRISALVTLYNLP